MNWTYIINQKAKAAIALGIVFLLVIGTNLLDKKYFSDLQDSFSSMYEDRLMAEIYVYQFSHLFYQKKVLTESPAESSNFLSKNEALNDSVSTLLLLYEGTKLTEKEAEIFKQLKVEINELLILESSKIADSEAQTGKLKKIELIHEKISNSLDGLSAIQQFEGKELIDNSKQIIASSSVTSQLEMGILIVIGLIMQALVFTSKSIIPKFSQNKNLN